MDPANRTRSGDRAKLAVGDGLSLVTICADGKFAEQLRGLIESIPMVQLRAELQHYLVDDEDTVFVDRLKDLRPDVCVIDFDRDRERAARTAEKIHESLSGTAVFAASANAQPDLIIAAMRCGCTEYLIKPGDRDQLLEALARVGGRKKEKREQASGQILAFLGAKGGCGGTTLATHLAALLAHRFARHTLLVDLHADMGDASNYLDLTRHQYHFYDLAENTHRLDTELLQSFLVRHASGLEVLPAPAGFEPPRLTSSDAVDRTLEFLRAQYDFVVVDCPPGLSDQNTAVIGRADYIYLVATPEVPSLTKAARYIEHLGRSQISPERLRVVINRHQKNSQISDAQIEKAIHKSIYWKVPNQYSEVMKTINTGSPQSLSPRTEFMRSLMGWAEALAGRSTSQAAQKDKEKEAKGVLGFFGR